MSLRLSTRVPFDEYIEKVNYVVDSGDFFYLKLYGNFDAIPAYWKHLDKHQRRDVATLIGLFYEESKADCLKEPWALPNIKKFLNIGYVKLDYLATFHATYLEIQGNYSVFVEPPIIDSSSDDTTKVEDDSVLLDENDGFVLKPKKLIK